MNPLAAYLLLVLKREANCATRTYLESEDALGVLGYWCLERPVSYSRESMPATRISTECCLVDTFLSHEPSLDGNDGFDILVDVYADPKVAD